MKQFIYLAVGALALAAGVVMAQFDGSPTSPLPYVADATMDVQVHSRDPGQWYTLQQMQAEHGADCSAPPAMHDTMGLYSSAVFECANHLMTAIGENSYGEIVLTPSTLLDLPGVVQFDVSTQRDSGRDWIDLWVTPWMDNLTLPFDAGDVDLQGQPRNAIHIDLDNNQFAPVVKVVRSGQETAYNDVYTTPPLQQGIAAGTNQAALRQTFRLTVQPTRIRFERLASPSATALVYFDKDVDPIGFSQGVVQFAHHSYNPTKDGAGVAATWHWDNLTVSGTSFQIIHTPKRYVDQTGSQVVVFNSPAPAQSWLRFSAIGQISVSFDSGKTYQAAQKQAFAGHLEHQASYFVPMPAGVQSVTIKFAADGWYSGPFIAQDFSIFSLSGGAPSSPTPSSTSTSTATLTPPTSTALATSTSVSTSTPASTPTSVVPTTIASPISTPTATPSPICHLTFDRSGVSQWTVEVPCS